MPCIWALSSALLAGSVRTTRCGTPSSRTAARTGVSRGSMARMMADRAARHGERRPSRCSARRLVRPALGVVGAVGVPLVTVGGGSHQLAQQAVQLLTLGGAEHGGDALLAFGLRPDGALPGGVALLRRLHYPAPPVARVGHAADQARLLQ